MGGEDSGACEEYEGALQENQAQGSFSLHFNIIERLESRDLYE